MQKKRAQISVQLHEFPQMNTCVQPGPVEGRECMCPGLWISSLAPFLVTTLPLPSPDTMSICASWKPCLCEFTGVVGMSCFPTRPENGQNGHVPKELRLTP